MKKLLLITLIIVTAMALGGYFFYRSYMADIIARALVSESLPSYVPKELQRKVEKIRAPLNKSTEAILKKMHDSHIPMEQVLRAVDNTTEQRAYAFLDELNRRQPGSTDEVFDIAKRYFASDFDMEVFREPFKEHVDMKQIRNAIAYANVNRKKNNVDLATGKAILKKILVEKEREIRDSASSDR